MTCNRQLRIPLSPATAENTHSPVKLCFSFSVIECFCALQNGTVLLSFLIIKPTRCTNFSNLFLEGKSTCFGQFLCPSSAVSRCTHSDGICHTGLLTACEQEHLLYFPSKNKFEKLVHLVGFIIRHLS